MTTTRRGGRRVDRARKNASGALAGTVSEPNRTDGERIIVGVDIGRDRGNLAIVWLNQRLHVDPRDTRRRSGISNIADVIDEPVSSTRSARSALTVAGSPARPGLAERGVRLVAPSTTHG